MTVRATTLDYVHAEDRLAHEAAVATVRARLTRPAWHDDTPNPLAALEAFRAARPWRTKAACLDYHPDVFYPPQTSPWSTRGVVGDAYARARAICATCPVRADCLADALADDDGYGMRGGLDPSQRKELRG